MGKENVVRRLTAQLNISRRAENPAQQQPSMLREAYQAIPIISNDEGARLVSDVKGKLRESLNELIKTAAPHVSDAILIGGVSKEKVREDVEEDNDDGITILRENEAAQIIAVDGQPFGIALKSPRSSTYLLPRTGEIMEISAKHSTPLTHFPDEDNFIGVEKLRKKHKKDRMSVNTYLQRGRGYMIGQNWVYGHGSEKWLAEKVTEELDSTVLQGDSAVANVFEQFSSAVVAYKNRVTQIQEERALEVQDALVGFTQLLEEKYGTDSFPERVSVMPFGTSYYLPHERRLIRRDHGDTVADVPQCEWIGVGRIAASYLADAVLSPEERRSL